MKHQKSCPSKIIPNTIVGDILSANAEMDKLFGNKVFSYPKPVTLIKYLISFFEEKNFIFMDFFSGSATSAQAIFLKNADDKGHRKFILVQLPENLDENLRKSQGKEEVVIKNAIALCSKLNVPHVLTEVAKERIRRAGKKIKEEAGMQGQDLDIGFRVLRLDSSNMEDVYYTPEDFNAQNIFTSVDNVKSDRTPLDLLFQVMPELNIELSAKIEEKEVNGKKVFFVDGGYIIATFDTDVNESTVTEIAKMKPQYFVMRDASAANDNVLDNFEQIFRHYSPDTIRKIL